ncbi:MAG: NtrC-family two-component system sensor histidine kinase KinB [Candidatus Pelagisphaera sp.]|jgi:NtrC-family two-component system sensor histidine kinase KinB
MLRSRLYFGMFPAAGVLIAICLYSIFNYEMLSKQLINLQKEQFNAISKTEKLLLATSQVDRALRLRQDGDNELSKRIFQRSQGVIVKWIQEHSEMRDDSRSESENELFQLVRNLESFTQSAFASFVEIPKGQLELLIERIEASALSSIAAHNEEIELINRQLQQQASTHFYVVMVGIIVSVVLMGFVSYFMSQRILKPIEALTRSANRLPNDEWETDYQPTRSDEIGELEIAFVDMATRLKEYKRITSKQLIRTRRRMEECFSNFPHPILFINARREFVYRNPSATSLIDSLGGKDGELHPSLASRVEKVFGTGEDVYSTDFEETISFRVDNEELHFLPIVVRIDSDELDQIECALILQDVTSLRLSDELKSDLVATLSHEIKTPVTSAGMALHLLLEKNLGGLNEDQEDMVQTATDDLKRLQRLLDHMLQIARLDRGNPTLNTELYSPKTIVENAIEPHAQIAEAKEIRVGHQVEAELPQVCVDPKLIHIALSNFVSNAIKYSDSNSEVTVYARKSDAENIRFGVFDDGPGIPEEDLAKIFDKFYRSSRTPSTDGVGLGLSICKDIVNAHKGLVGCFNRSKGGTDFYFQLPIGS